MSLEWVSVLWLAHILSEGDHRLNPLAPWAKQRLHTAILSCQHLTKPWSLSHRAISSRTEMDHKQTYHLPSAAREAFVRIMGVACGEERSSGKVTIPMQPQHHVLEA